MDLMIDLREKEKVLKMSTVERHELILTTVSNSFVGTSLLLPPDTMRSSKAK